jgi:hypothetical protein
MNYYLTKIDIQDLPELNENYHLPPPYNRVVFNTKQVNPGIQLGSKTKYNYNGVHNITPWSSICQRVHDGIQPFLNNNYRICSSWINYYRESNAVQWHEHYTRQLIDITTILFLTSNPSPLLLSASTTPKDFENLRKTGNIHIEVTDTIETIAGNVIAFRGDMAHMVSECKLPNRWTLTTNFKRVL